MIVICRNEVWGPVRGVSASGLILYNISSYATFWRLKCRLPILWFTVTHNVPTQTAACTYMTVWKGPSSFDLTTSNGNYYNLRRYNTGTTDLNDYYYFFIYFLFSVILFIYLAFCTSWSSAKEPESIGYSLSQNVLNFQSQNDLHPCF